jgi:hypothetical protein
MKHHYTNEITQPFQTSIGVKQGCVLSQTFFSVYMNDSVEHFNLECDPVSINGKSISCFLLNKILVNN